METDTARRRFLRQTICALIAAGVRPLPASVAAGIGPPYKHVPNRHLGKTRESVSILGLSGTHLARMDRQTGREILQRADEIKGKTVIDLTWDEGKAARLVGQILDPGRRDKLFLVAGTDGLGKDACMDQLEAALNRLRVRSIDLWVIKESVYEAGADRVFSEDGAIGAAMQARREKKVRHIGIAGYRNPEFFEAAMTGYFDFQAAEIPMNGIAPHYRAFQESVLPRLRTRNIGTIVANPIAWNLEEKRPLNPEQILGLLWSQLITVVAAGVASPEAFETYTNIARRFETIARHLRPQLMARLSRM